MTAVTLQSISVTPPNPTITLGNMEQFTATGTYSDSSMQNISSSVAWTSGTTSVAMINATTGLATSVSTGVTKIQAALSGITGSTNLTVNNAVPAISSLSPPHAPAGTAFTLTVNGVNFLSSSTASFNGKSEATTYVSATQLTLAIPASDVSSGGTDAVIVTNPSPGGGPSSPANFTVDDFSLSGPSGTVGLTPGQGTSVPLTITPGANGFADPVQLSVSNLPSGVTAQFLHGASVTPGSAATTDTLTLTVGTTARIPLPGNQAPLGPPALLASLLAGALLVLRRRMSWQALTMAPVKLALWLVLVVGMGISLTSCTGGFPAPNPKYTVVVTGTSGTVQHSTQVSFVIE